MNQFNDILKMEVINLFDGRRIGYISDIAADFYTGKIESIIIYGKSGWFGRRNSKNDIVIPFKKIVSIGEDLVIVDYDENQLKLN